MTPPHVIRLAALATLTFVVIATLARAMSPTTAPAAEPFEPVESARLHNAHRVTDKVLSGAQPDDEQAFEALRALGVRTLISVDGAAPNVELARKFGMRYVHMPIGYDGVPTEMGEQIARAIVDLPGPIYIHCHHGKHRSAAAVAVACVYNGTLSPDQAERVLRTFGTGLNYKGLWRDATLARPLDPRELQNVRVDYVEIAQIPDLAAAMLHIDHRNDLLKLVRRAGWVQPPDHPDLDPAHEALQLEEHYREMSRLQSVADRPDDFRALLADAQQSAADLHAALRASPADKALADSAFKRVAASCINCHKSHRD